MLRPLRTGLSLAWAVTLLTGCISAPSESDMVDTGTPSRIEYAVGAGQPIELEIPAGEIDIRGEEFAGVAGTVSVRCPRDSQRCARWASDARLIVREESNRVVVALNKKARANADVKVSMVVPRNSPLAMSVDYGALRIEDMADHVRVKMKAGELHIEMPAHAVREAHLRARFGDASMSLGPRSMEGRRPTLVGAKVDWNDGHGEHTVDARLRYGEVRLDLYD